MFNKLAHKLTVSTAKSLLTNDRSELDIGKRIISIIAGTYALQRGIRSLSKQPLLGAQEIFLGGLLLYNAAAGIEQYIKRKPRKISEVRKNQIQGNDPDCPTPAFV